MKGTASKLFFLALSFGIPLSVYALMTSSHVAPGDSTEMVTAAVTLGIPHQPSYPLNTLIGHLFYKSPLPMGDVARVNFASGVIQALTVAVFYLGMVELIHYYQNHKSQKSDDEQDVSDNSPLSIYLAAFTASLFLAFSGVFWQYSLKFEVFPLNNLFTVTLVYLSLVYKRVKEQESERAGGNRKGKLTFLFIIFLSGLAVTHHQTVILIFPALAILFKDDIRRRIEDKDLDYSHLIALVAGAIPFFVLLMAFASRQPLLNQGKVETLFDAFNNLRRTDFGTFSAFEKGLGPQIKTTYPFDQVTYYLSYVLRDISLFGVAGAVAGIWYLLREKRNALLFVLTGLFISGFVFLGYANFSLSDGFNQATARRFHMLPNIFVVYLIGFGAYFALRTINSAKVRVATSKAGIFLANVFIVSTVGLGAYNNYDGAKIISNDLTTKYIDAMYSAVEQDSLVLLSGDIPNMTSQYWRFVVDEGVSFRAFSPGQFHLKWFNKWLIQTYPEVEIPPPYPDKLFTLTSQIVDANYGKGWRFYVGPDLVVNAPLIEQDYTLYPRHLLFQVVKKGGDLPLEAWRTENDAVWASIDLDQFNQIRKNSPMFEESIIFHYIRHFHNVGNVYEDVGLNEDAIREYGRALVLDPAFKESLAGLSRIYGEKMEKPDYPKAVEYLQRYVSVLEPGEEAYAQAAYGKMQEYDEKWQKEQANLQEEYQREMEEQEESTSSAETEE